MPKYEADTRGSWLFEGGHKFDLSLASGIADILAGAGVKTVIDIGCGDGSYCQYLSGFGFEVVGYDGNPNTEKVTAGNCHTADFSEPHHFGLHDAVISLEVGEHIPEDYEDIFFENLSRHADKLIILSWAVPEQGGFGHVNERENTYIIMAMGVMGWFIDREKTDALRSKATLEWFRETAMVFGK